MNYSMSKNWCQHTSLLMNRGSSTFRRLRNGYDEYQLDSHRPMMVTSTIEKSSSMAWCAWCMNTWPWTNPHYSGKCNQRTPVLVLSATRSVEVCRDSIGVETLRNWRDTTRTISVKGVSPGMHHRSANCYHCELPLWWLTSKRSGLNDKRSGLFQHSH